MTYEETNKTIKGYLNKLNDNIRLLSENGYDTSDLYELYDLLRYEILNDNSIEELYNKGLTDEIIKKLGMFDSINNDIVHDLKASIESRDHYDNEYKNKQQRNLESLKKPIEEDKKRIRNYLIRDIILFLIPMVGFGFTSRGIYKSFKKSPIVHEYYYDTVGNNIENSRFTDEFSSNLIVKEYSDVDILGNRTMKKYQFTGNQFIDKETLSSLDLSSGKLVSDEVIHDESINEVSKSAYRSFEFAVQDKNIIGEVEEMNVPVVILLDVIFLIVFLAVFGAFMSIYVADISDTDGFVSIFAIFKELKNDTLKLKQAIDDMKVSENERKKYQKFINILEKRLDKMIRECVEKMSFEKYKSSYQKIKNANDLNKQYNDLLTETEEEKRKNMESINKKLKEISALLKEIGNLNNKDAQKLLHSIAIPDILLFEKVGNHYVIKEELKPHLKVLDLSMTSFKNVDVRDVDFTDTNASIDPREVYKMDLSGATFDDRNIIDFKDYDGVNITDTILREKDGTMINLDKAINHNLKRQRAI